MSRCPTFNFQFSIMSKLLAKHIITKVSYKITIRKRYVYIEFGWPSYETSVSIWDFEMMVVKNDSFAFISPRYTIKITKHKWNWV